MNKKVSSDADNYKKLYNKTSINDNDQDSDDQLNNQGTRQSQRIQKYTKALQTNNFSLQSRQYASNYLNTNKEEKKKVVDTNQRGFQNQYRYWRNLDNLTMALTIAGLGITIYILVYDIIQIGDACNNPSNASECNKFLNKNVHNYNKEDRKLNHVVFILSILSVIIHCLSFYFQTKWIKIFEQQQSAARRIEGKAVIENTYVRQRRSSLIVFYLELLVLMVCPIPGLNYTFDHTINIANKPVLVQHTLLEYLMVFMFLRLYFVARACLNYSFKSNAFSKTLCTEYGFYPGLSFVMKTKFLKNPGTIIMLLLVLTVLVIPFIIMVFEIQFFLDPAVNMNQGIYFNSIYLVMITLTTVGYGDISPKTQAGKVVIIFTAIWGAVQISFLVLIISNGFNLSKNEEAALKKN